VEQPHYDQPWGMMPASFQDSPGVCLGVGK